MSGAPLTLAEHHRLGTMWAREPGAEPWHVVNGEATLCGRPVPGSWPCDTFAPHTRCRQCVRIAVGLDAPPLPPAASLDWGAPPLPLSRSAEPIPWRTTVADVDTAGPVPWGWVGIGAFLGATVSLALAALKAWP